MRIRTLFIGFSVTLVLLSGAMGVWQVLDSRNKILAVQWVQSTNQLQDSVLKVSIQLAMERGLTAGLLAKSHTVKAPTPQINDLRIAIAAQRLSTNAAFALIQQELEALAQIVPAHPVALYQRKQKELYLRFISLRQRVDQEPTTYPVQEWIASSTEIIEALQEVSNISKTSVAGNIYSHSTQSLAKFVLSNLAEHLGRERALVVANLAQESQFSTQQMATLVSLRALTDYSLVRIVDFLKRQPESLNLQKNYQLLVDNYQQQQQVIQQLLDESAQQQGEIHYSIDMESWFAQATTSIQYVENMLAEISKQHDEQIGQLHHQASLTSALQLTAMLILGLLFGGALYLLNNFVLKPIGKLAQASNNIALGQLDIPIAKMANNELGELGQSFERMRLQIKNDLAIRLQNELELTKLNTAIDQSMAAVQITNAQGIVEYSNNQFEKVTGYSSQELVGKKAGIWRSGETKDSTYADLWSTIQRGQVWIGELLNKRKNGEYYWALVSISPVIVEQKITHFIDIHLDISEHKRVAERLDFISYYDQTTNLPNRQLLARHYEQVQKNYVKLAIVSISLGRLKQINDSFGWAVGDQVLRIIGQRLKSVVSKNDIVSHLEGGHFALMLCQPHDNNALHIYVQQVIDELNKPINIEKYSLQLIPNAGICVSQSRSCKFEQVLKNANIALHRAEQSADSSVCIFSNEINLDVQQRVVLEHALRQAIENNQLELHYQPKVEIETGKILSVEALARWFHPDSNKMISPVVFVRLAEENGLINALGDWVLRQACRQLKAWQQQGLNELTMAVNISFEQLRQAGFVHRVEQIINEENVDPQYLEFELTESIFMENPEQAMIIFAELKNMGIKLAIDDFGTGYSSLAYLSRLPVDFLKIDRSFVEEMTVDHRAAAITTSIIALGHRMGLRVIAEGVETAAQLAYLAQHRCDQMQGFYFSRPVPAQGLLKLFEKETVS